LLIKSITLGPLPVSKRAKAQQHSDAIANYHKDQLQLQKDNKSKKSYKKIDPEKTLNEETDPAQETVNKKHQVSMNKIKKLTSDDVVQTTVHSPKFGGSRQKQLIEERKRLFQLTLMKPLKIPSQSNHHIILILLPINQLQITSTMGAYILWKRLNLKL
jgi:hypothetical protein